MAFQSFRALVKQGEPPTFVGRVRDLQGKQIKQANITSITAYCYDLLNANAAVTGFPQSLSIPAVVFDSLQQDPILWPYDSVGYNFLWTGPQTMFPNGIAGQTYRVEFEFTLTSGLKFTGECNCQVATILTAPLP